jgi:D-alanyl-D-alanine carboxypeptidase
MPELPDWDTTVRNDVTPQEIIKAASAIPLDFAPGSQFHYSNTGYTVLAAILQKVSGKSYEEFVREHILAPLKMDATRVDSRSDVIPGRAPGYYGSRSRGTLYNAEYYSPQQYLGSGCLVSSARDLAKWDIALRNGAIFSDTKPQPFTARLFDFGWGKTGTRDHRTVWTGGGLYGHTCSMIRFIDDDITVIVLTNFSDGAPDVMARHIAGIYVPALAESANEVPSY